MIVSFILTTHVDKFLVSQAQRELVHSCKVPPSYYFCKSSEGWLICAYKHVHNLCPHCSLENIWVCAKDTHPSSLTTAVVWSQAHVLSYGCGDSPVRKSKLQSKSISFFCHNFYSLINTNCGTTWATLFHNFNGWRNNIKNWGMVSLKLPWSG